MKGKHHSPEAKKKMSDSHKGNPGPWKGKCRSEDTKNKIREATVRQLTDPTTRERLMSSLNNPDRIKKISEAAKRQWKNPDVVKKMMNGFHSKTRPEKRLDNLLQQLYPGEFVYNGKYDAGISLDGLVPDFVNINGKKQVIDVHGDYWHEGEDVTIRASRYAKCGFSSLIIWEKELKDTKQLVMKITEFVGKVPTLYFEPKVN